MDHQQQRKAKKRRKERARRQPTPQSDGVQEEIDAIAARTVRQLVVGAMVGCAARVSSVDDAVKKLSRPLQLDNARAPSKRPHGANRSNIMGWRKKAKMMREKEHTSATPVWKASLPPHPTWGWVVSCHQAWVRYAIGVVRLAAKTSAPEEVLWELDLTFAAALVTRCASSPSWVGAEVVVLRELRDSLVVARCSGPKASSTAGRGGTQAAKGGATGSDSRPASDAVATKLIPKRGTAMLVPLPARGAKEVAKAAPPQLAGSFLALGNKTSGSGSEGSSSSAGQGSSTSLGRAPVPTEAAPSLLGVATGASGGTSSSSSSSAAAAGGSSGTRPLMLPRSLIPPEGTPCRWVECLCEAMRWRGGPRGCGEAAWEEYRQDLRRQAAERKRGGFGS